MNQNKENSKKTFDKQAISYDTDIVGEHARNLYAPILKKLKQEEHVELLPVKRTEKKYKIFPASS